MGEVCVIDPGGIGSTLALLHSEGDAIKRSASAAASADAQTERQHHNGRFGSWLCENALA